MKNLKFQAAKEAKPETNLKSVISEEYYYFLDVFSKKNSNTLLFHQKYNYKIILEEKQKHNYVFF